MPEGKFHCVITSPPYFWQRDYNVEGQIGKESTIQAYVEAVADAMDEVKRVMRKDGVLFLNMGDTYYSAKGEQIPSSTSNRRQNTRNLHTSGTITG